jgi:uncharacterized surface anchored protein
VPYTKTTDSNGNYLFTDLKPGKYIVEITDTKGYSLTSPLVGNDRETDSDFDQNTKKSVPVNLSSGENNLTIDGGLYIPVSLGDLV